MVPVEGAEGGLRAGVPALLSISKSLNHMILRGLSEGPRAETWFVDDLPAARATAFRHLGELEQLGAVRRWRRSGSRSSFCALAEPAGSELFELATLFERAFPDRPDEVTLTAKGLAAGFNTTALRWLAAGPCGVRDLNTQAPTGIGLAEVEAARDAMLAADLIDAEGRERQRRYKVTAKAGESICFLAAALRWHRRNFSGPAVPLERVDAETLLLLLAGRLILPDELTGVCALIVADLGDVGVRFRRGRVVDQLVPDPGGLASASVRGSVSDWLALLDGRPERLQLEGKDALASATRRAVGEICEAVKVPDND